MLFEIFNILLYVYVVIIIKMILKEKKIFNFFVLIEYKFVDCVFWGY